jgi:hypothetical protein
MIINPRKRKLDILVDSGFDQILKGDVTIKKLSEHNYKIIFNKIYGNRLFMYQVFNKNNKYNVNDKRFVTYIPIENVIFAYNDITINNKKLNKIPFTPTAIMEFPNFDKYPLVIDNIYTKKNCVIFTASTKEIKFLNGVCKKKYQIPCGKFKHVRFDIDETEIVARNRENDCGQNICELYKQAGLDCPNACENTTFGDLRKNTTCREIILEMFNLKCINTKPFYSIISKTDTTKIYPIRDLRYRIIENVGLCWHTPLPENGHFCFDRTDPFELTSVCATTCPYDYDNYCALRICNKDESGWPSSTSGENCRQFHPCCPNITLRIGVTLTLSRDVNELADKLYYSYPKDVCDPTDCLPIPDLYLLDIIPNNKMQMNVSNDSDTLIIFSYSPSVKSLDVSGFFSDKKINVKFKENNKEMTVFYYNFESESDKNNFISIFKQLAWIIKIDSKTNTIVKKKIQDKNGLEATKYDIEKGELEYPLLVKIMYSDGVTVYVVYADDTFRN